MAKRGIPWRDYLTAEEAEVIARGDAAKVSWLALNGLRAGIVNRAIKRAQYAMATGKDKSDGGNGGRLGGDS